MDIEDNISNFMNLLFSCFFYAPILPLAIPIALIGIFLNYWITKYMLTNMHKMPEELGTVLTTFFADMLPLTSIFMAVSYYVVSRSLFKTLELVNDER